MHSTVENKSMLKNAQKGTKVENAQGVKHFFAHDIVDLFFYFSKVVLLVRKFLLRISKESFVPKNIALIERIPVSAPVYIHFYIVSILYVQEVVTQPKILNRTILYNLVHVT